MNQTKQTNNQKLRELIDGANLTHTAALELFNREFGVRGLTESAWKGYFCNPNSSRYRSFSDALISHAEKIFTPLSAK